MTATLLFAGALISALAFGTDAPKAPVTNAASAFARLKGLTGEWQADTQMGKARLVYEVIAGGNTVVERESVGDMPPMMTVYHLDGTRLLLTHYCMAGNQPRMEAKTFEPGAREIRFQFLDATNLPTPDAPHMHNATIRFIDDNHIESEWQFFENNRAKTTEKSQYTRVR